MQRANYPMSHREKSLYPWITNETHGVYAVTMREIVETTCMPKPMTNAEKHEKSIRETGYPCTIIPLTLYALAEAAGHDMRRFVPWEPVPVTDPLSALYIK